MSANVRVSLMKWGFFLLALLWLASSAGSTGRASAYPSGSFTVTGGVLRWGTASSWRVYDNGHSSSGIASARCNAKGWLVVRFRESTRQVGFGSADVDEHLAAKGITVGVSASTDELRLMFYRHEQRLSCHSSYFRDRLSNVWLLWMVPSDI